MHDLCAGGPNEDHAYVCTLPLASHPPRYRSCQTETVMLLTGMAGGCAWSRRIGARARTLRGLVRDTQRALQDVADILSVGEYYYNNTISGSSRP